MKITSKVLTGRAAALTKAQAILTDTERRGAALVDQILNANNSHAELLNQRENLQTARESLLIELDASPDEQSRLDRLLDDNEAATKEASEAIHELKEQSAAIVETLEQEDQERQAEATQANRELKEEIIQCDEIKQAWSVLGSYWVLELGKSWSALHDELQDVEVGPTEMPRLCRHRSSEALEKLRLLED